MEKLLPNPDRINNAKNYVKLAKKNADLKEQLKWKKKQLKASIEIAEENTSQIACLKLKITKARLLTEKITDLWMNIPINNQLMNNMLLELEQSLCEEKKE